MPDLPSGTVTFLFTDIEGSTRLWEEAPDAMRLALARHDSLLRAAIETNGGVVFKTVGDAFCAAFPSATQAIDAALIGQHHLLAASSSTLQRDLELKVRMALHSGEAEVRAGDYFGPALNRVARLLSVGYGGQVLVSASTQELVRDDSPAGATLQELGSHRLRDLTRPEEVFQLCHPSLPSDFPPLRSLDYLPNNLPRQLTSFVGRAREIHEVKELLEGTALLTLTGAGGCGKTRLALQVAAELLDEYPDGVWLVEFAALADSSLVPQTVAGALGLTEESQKPVLQTLTEYVKPRKLLLLADNCEHLLDACAALAQSLLRSCGKLSIVATSRESLGIAGEMTYRVPSLSVPEPGHSFAKEDVPRYGAVQLFAERAVFHSPAFVVTDQSAPALAAVCHRLDGIPLAIELAAARVRSLSIEEINSRLDQRFRLLTGGSRTSLPRQQTLRSLIDWSYDLLRDTESALLQRLSVFAGGWSLEAAEAVCSGAGIEEWEVLDLLTSLVDKSLVVPEQKQGRTRYRLLESVRQYARDRLLESGQNECWRARHRDHFLAVAEEARMQLLGPAQDDWLERLEAEHDNLRAALELCAEDPASGQPGMRLAGALWRFWEIRAYNSEGRERCRTALAHAGAQTSSGERSAALNTAGWLAYRQNDYVAAGELLEESLRISRTLDDAADAVSPLLGLGCVAAGLRDDARAMALFEEAATLCRRLQDRHGEAMSFNNLGSVAESQGDYEAARSFYEQAHMLLATDDRAGLSIVLGNLCRVALLQNDLPRARALLSEALALDRATRDRRSAAGDLETAAGVEIHDARHGRAARLLAAASALREQIGAPPHPLEQEYNDRRLLAMRDALTESELADSLATGRAMDWEAAIAYALGEVEPS